MSAYLCLEEEQGCARCREDKGTHVRHAAKLSHEGLFPP